MMRVATIIVASLAWLGASRALSDAPVMSIGARIAAAKDGDLVEVEAGTYREHVRIDKSIRLVGKGQPVIDGGGNGDLVEISAVGVELSGFVLRDTGTDLDHENCAVRVLAPRATIVDNIIEDSLFGIDLKAASETVIRGNRIGAKRLDIARRGDGLRLWRSDGVLIENNEILGGRDAILWYSKSVVVRQNKAMRCRYGLHLMFSDDVTIEDNEFIDNSVGVYFMYSQDLVLRRNRFERNRGPSGYGIGLKETDKYTVEDNLFAGNRVGIYLDGSPFTGAKPATIAGNTFAYNDIGMVFLPSVRGNLIVSNNFIDNIEQISVQGRGELLGNDFSRNDHGNYWSDYVGYDEDRDGVGDYEYASERLFENMLDRDPKLRLFLLSPAEQLIEFVARALPAVRPEPKFTDSAPLVAPVPNRAAHSLSAGSVGSLAVVGLSLVTVGAAVLVAAASGAGLARVDRTRIIESEVPS